MVGRSGVKENRATRRSERQRAFDEAVRQLVIAGEAVSHAGLPEGVPAVGLQLDVPGDRVGEGRLDHVGGFVRSAGRAAAVAEEVALGGTAAEVEEVAPSIYNIKRVIEKPTVEEAP